MSTTNDPLGIDDDFVERYKQWEAEHSVCIPADESWGVKVNIVVWEPECNGRIRVDTVHRSAVANLTPERARRLSSLLLESADAVDNAAASMTE